MKARIWGAVAGVLCTGAVSAQDIRVAVDIAPVHSIVASVMDGVGVPDLIVRPEESPHEFNMRPSTAQALQDADIVFWMGEALVPNLEKPLETVASEATVLELSDVDEAIRYDFREVAVFEGDAHDDEHGAHDDHDDHSDHDDEHVHGEHAFEWAGLFDLKAGTYNWSFAKVDGDYADPAMKMVILSASDIEAAEETAEGLLEAKASDAKADGDVLTAKDKAYSLNFDAAKEMTVFSVNIDEDGTYAFFTEHMPFEFEANEHFFKDDTGADVEPIAQEPETDDHAHGHHHHHHDGLDPHMWLDPENAKVWAAYIASVLSEADPDNAATYKANADGLIKDIDVATQEIAATLKPVADQRFVVFHDAYQYFENRFGLSVAGALLESDASSPSAARLVEIQDIIEDQDIQCVFVEPQFNPKLVTAVAAKAKTGEIDPLGAAYTPGPDLYLDVLNSLATSVADCLKG